MSGTEPSGPWTWKEDSPPGRGTRGGGSWMECSRQRLPSQIFCCSGGDGRRVIHLTTLDITLNGLCTTLHTWYIPQALQRTPIPSPFIVSHLLLSMGGGGLMGWSRRQWKDLPWLLLVPFWPTVHSLSPTTHSHLPWQLQAVQPRQGGGGRGWDLIFCASRLLMTGLDAQIISQSPCPTYCNYHFLPSLLGVFWVGVWRTMHLPFSVIVCAAVAFWYTQMGRWDRYVTAPAIAHLPLHLTTTHYDMPC